LGKILWESTEHHPQNWWNQENQDKFKELVEPGKPGYLQGTSGTMKTRIYPGN